jgi:hypothetical protein
MVATAPRSGGDLRFWSIPHATPVGNLKEYSEVEVQALAFAPNGEFLVVATRENAVQIFPKAAFMPIAELQRAAKLQLPAKEQP